MIEFNGIEIPVQLHNKYIDRLIASVFKILPIYEDCAYALNKPFEQYQTYLDKVITILMGAEQLYNGTVFIEIATMLKGLQIREDLSQKEVKSMVFHCIEMLDKLKQEE